MPQRSADDALELESPLTIEDAKRLTVGVDPARVEELVTPFDDWILLRMDPPTEATRSGIKIAAQSVPESRIGVIVSQGEGLLLTDGKGRLPMHAAVGDRVLIERRAGKTLPRVPDATNPRTGEIGYLLIRNGGIISRLSKRAKRREKAKGDKLEGPVDLSPRDVLPVGDWTWVRTDKPIDQTDPRLPRKSGVLAPTLALPQSEKSAAMDRSDTWSGTVLAQGPGRFTEDGKGVAAPRTKIGARVLFTGGVFNQTVPGINGHLLVLEREVVVAGLDG